MDILTGLVASHAQKSTVGTATDAAPEVAHAATSTNNAAFDYASWFGHCSDTLGNASSDDGASNHQDQEDSSPEDDCCSRSHSVASCSSASNDRLLIQAKEGPAPVAAAIDTPQLNHVLTAPEGEQLTDSNGMLWRPLQSEPQMSLRNLGDEIKTFVDTHLTLTPDEVTDRDRFISKLRNLLKETISPECKLKVHGSFVTDLALRESDIDFLVTDYAPMQPIAAIDKMTLALLQFTNDDTPTKVASSDVSVLNRTSGPSPGTYVPTHEGEVFTVQAIVFTRVPIIKITERKTGIKGDLSFGGGHHDESMRLTRRLLTRFPTARPLLLFLKNILKDGQMGESAKGGLSSFALYLLVMHFYNIRFHCDGRMWEPTRTTADADAGSSFSATPNSLADSAARFGSPGVGASASTLTAALGGTRLEKVGSHIESFLSGDQSPAAESNPDPLPLNDPTLQRAGDDSETFVEENDPRTLGEVFCLFCWYYSEFEIQTKGIVFDEDGNSFVVQKPESLRGKATLHMTSPFDPSYDITVRMTCIQAFQQLLFLVTVIITAGAKEQSLSLNTLHEQIRECFVDYSEPFDDTAYRIYSKSSMLLAGPYNSRGRGGGARGHVHKGHGPVNNNISNTTMSGHNGIGGGQHHSMHQYTYFHTQGSYAPHQYHGYGVHPPGPQAMQQQSQSSQIMSPVSALPATAVHPNYYRDGASNPMQAHAVDKRGSGADGRALSSKSQPHHLRGDSALTAQQPAPPQNAHSHPEGGVSKIDATTATCGQTIPRTATVTTQTAGNQGHPAMVGPHSQFLHPPVEAGMYAPNFFQYGSSFPPQHPVGPYGSYYGGYPAFMHHPPGAVGPMAMGVMGQGSASLPGAPNGSYGKMKRGLGKAPFEQQTSPVPLAQTPMVPIVHDPSIISGGSAGSASFPHAVGGVGRGRGAPTKSHSLRQSPPIHPTSIPNPSMPIPQQHAFFAAASGGKMEHILVPLPPAQQQMTSASQPALTQPTVATVSNSSAVASTHAKIGKAAKKAAAAAAAALDHSQPPLSVEGSGGDGDADMSTGASVARYVPPCRKPKPKTGEVDA